jgi:hypothetical protein
VCLQGEQLLGGGYELPRDGQNRLTVLGSYPSSPNSWSIAVHRQATTTLKEDRVIAVAYCMKAPLDAGLTTHTVDVTVTPTQPWADSLPVPCPAGATVTGGGYRTEVTADAVAFNAFVNASAPFIDASYIARGWFVGVHYRPGDTIPKTTV